MNTREQLTLLLCILGREGGRGGRGGKEGGEREEGGGERSYSKHYTQKGEIWRVHTLAYAAVAVCASGWPMNHYNLQTSRRTPTNTVSPSDT